MHIHKKNMKKNRYLLIIFHLYSIFIFSQNIEIEGIVIDKDKKPIPNILISILTQEKEIIKYKYSDNGGKFNFSVDGAKNPFFLKASSLFYLEKQITINFQEKIIISLSDKVEMLNEVVINNSKINNDTINLGISKYNIKKEESIEKTLKKIPGISVDKDGRIKYWNTEIEKILIDGDDLADKQYTFISKNLRSEVLDDIQILKNFEENTVFKRSRKSDKIALNLKIKEEFTNIWFGNILIGYGNGSSNESEHKVHSNVGLLRKKIKFLNSQKLSSLGDKSIPDFFGDQNRTNNKPVYNLKKNDISLPDEVTNFNNGFNNTFLINKKTKNLVFRATNFIGVDNQKQELFSSTDFFFQEEDSFTERNSNNERNTLFLGELELKNQGSERNFFINKLEYKIGNNRFSSSSIFNNNQVSDANRTREFDLYDNLQFTHRFKNGLILNNEINFGISNLTQNTSINSSDLSLVAQNPNSNTEQNVKKHLKSFGIKSDFTYLISRNLKSNLLFNFNNIEEDFDIALIPNNTSFQNDFNVKRNEFIIKPTLIFRLSKKASLKGNISSNFFRINNQSQVLFNHNTILSLNYFGSLDISFSQIQRFPENQTFLQNFFLTNINSFRRGGLFFEPLNYSQFKFKLNNSNESRTYNNEFSFEYKNSKSSILNEFSLVNNINFNNTSFIKRQGDEYIFKEQLIFLVNSFGFKLETTQSLLFVPLNNQNTERTRLYDGIYSFEISSYFSSSLNFNMQFEYNSNIQTFENNKSTFDSKNLKLAVDWNISEVFNFNLNTEIYELERDVYNLVNVSLKYTPQDSKLSYGLKINNLLNEDEFAFQQRNSFFSSVTRIPLVPFYTFATIKYIF
jgi:hypothetical protein